MGRDIEGPIHRAIYGWLKVQFPRAVIHHSPNEMNIKASPVSKAIAQNKSKALGMVPGFPDLIMLTGGRLYAYEVKSPKGVTSDNQATVGADIQRNRGEWAVVRSLDEAKAVTQNWGLLRTGRSPYEQDPAELP